jgi:Polyketide cyclase / dehydrase and lipid transport
MTDDPSTIDHDAPVVAHHEIAIEASLATVWDLHTDVNGWTSWHPDITEAHLAGPLEPGASFHWSSYGFPVTSTVYEVADQARVLWGGTASGITGIHEWIFEERDGGVRVTTNESFAGDPVAADPARCKACSTSRSRPGWQR